MLENGTIKANQKNLLVRRMSESVIGTYVIKTELFLGIKGMTVAGLIGGWLIQVPVRQMFIVKIDWGRAVGRDGWVYSANHGISTKEPFHSRPLD